jgi:hypothetical protein
MATDFYNSPRGCVVKHSKGGGNNAGFELEGFDFSDKEHPIILRNISLNDEDIVLPVSTLDKKKVLYVFGEDFGSIQISGSVFLGPAGESTSGLGPVVSYFNKKAVARGESTAPVKFSIPGNVSYSIYLKSIVISQADAELNMHDFAFGAIIADSTAA